MHDGVLPKRKGILFVISGPSGVGKGTLKDTLLKQQIDIQYSVSATTRPPRPGEVHGEHYFFLSKDTFCQLVEQGEFLEWALVYDHYYGTPRSFVLENLQKGQDVLLEIDIQGARQIRHQFPEGVFIFIAPPDVQELARRLRKRGKDSIEAIEKRLSSYAEEMAQLQHYDYLVVNDRVEAAAEKLVAIMVAERCRVTRLIRGEDNETAFDK
ncbi:MAG TPA: guanylate kinase [Syntrophothermus lipocalidus]|uniref:Guanylate kinase n=1 Tax=Syntrophothermus lipocalidus (strain DSM 12680 / TGB-C1) TaxID=643648 RepID=D7CLP9_SYNLT|nr:MULTISPECIES: guanylate kinase [Syntrophothermus]ADI01634.1 guanylate kinase [Syntrophothermus lipocalidus DSM 12680]NSW82246.1 guanylate kinase [Syntrophothermus sp.]HHV77031.1 guanylate kinase [Syntrophothermus lipocalidus]